MPRNGSGVFELPFPDVETMRPIESAVYNGFTHDVANDLNTPRPIIAGGTGANNARDAMIALKGEVTDEAVTNYDSHPFVAGSFFSAEGATNAPTATGHYYGICYVLNPTYLTIEVRNHGTGKKYTRTMGGGIWGSWSEMTGTQADNDARYVNVAGDTMTGPLVALAKSNQIGNLGGALATAPVTIADANFILYGSGANWAGMGADNNGNMWFRTGLSGTPVPAFRVNAIDQNVVFEKIITIGAGGASGSLYFGNTGTKNLTFDGTNFSLNGGNFYVNSAIISTGDIIFGNGVGNCTLYWTAPGNSRYLNWNGTKFIMSGGPLQVGHDIFSMSGSIFSEGNGSSGNVHYWIRDNGATKAIWYWERSSNDVVTETPGGQHRHLSNGVLRSAKGYNLKSGLSGSYNGASAFNFNWDGSLNVWIDGTYVGNATITSDYRTKRNVEALPSTWETVKALRPIKYNRAEFDPPSQIAAREKARADYQALVKAAYDAGNEPPADPGALVSLFKADDIERWGFVAHELQETLVPSAATGVKDAPDTIQSPDPFPIIAALTKALQEAMTRIEALEARLA